MDDRPPNPPAPRADVRPAGGLPGLRGADHVGLTVPDLDAAERFFVDVLGAEPFYGIGPIAAPADRPQWMADQLDVHPQARIERVKFLRLGFGLNVELLEYRSPDQPGRMPRNSDYGASHLALYTDDFAAALAHLRKHGVQVLGEPTVRVGGPNDGLTWVYFRAPWGICLELVSYPNGKGYERSTPRRLWDPRFPHN